MEQADVVKHALSVLAELELEYAIVGSFASIAYGEPRFTHDIDILINFPEQKVSAFCQAFPPPDWYVSEQAALDAVRRKHPFNVIHTTSGNKIDVFIALDTEWQRLQLQRREQVGIVDDVVGYAAHPEDVILGKLVYYKEGGSDKHLRDIMGILDISGDRVDLHRLRQWAQKLAVEDVLVRLEQDRER